MPKPQSTPSSFGQNAVHPFPARMAPRIAFNVLRARERQLRVLDPMMGSGTVLSIARALGHDAQGVDIDPLAVLISKVWTTPITPKEITEAAECVLADARSAFNWQTLAEAYYPGADDETRLFTRYWFDALVRKQLTCLVRSIEAVRNGTTRNLLWCAMSRMIITKASGVSLAMDLSHSRPHKVYDRAPVKPYDRFLDSVAHVVKHAPHVGDGIAAVTTPVLGDARRLMIPDNSIDIVITSPPYLNAIDYMRCSKFSLIWMGYSIEQIRKIRGASIGAESKLKLERNKDIIDKVMAGLKVMSKLSERNIGILRRYILDLNESLQEVSRVLVPAGEAVYVVGDSTIKGAFIRNSMIVQHVAELNRLHLTRRPLTRKLPENKRYLPPPSSNQAGAQMGSRMRREVVISLAKE